MKTLLFAGAAALSMAIVPAIGHAQAPNATTNSVEDKRAEMTAEQQAMYDSWPADYRTAYDSWPAEQQTMYFVWPADLQTYYWTLTPAQQNAYWMLTDEQKMQVYALPEGQRATTWASIVSQVNAQTGETMPATQAGTSGSMEFVGNAMVQDIPAPHQGEYPPCRGEVQDNCINPREAGLNYGNRPLDYWPGQPASEM